MRRVKVRFGLRGLPILPNAATMTARIDEDAASAIVEGLRAFKRVLLKSPELQAFREKLFFEVVD